MRTCTTYETEFEIADRTFAVFAELDVNVSEGREGFEHFGFRGSIQTSETEVEVTDFGVRDEAGNEVEDKAIRKQIETLLEAEVYQKADNIAERVS